MSIDRTLLPSVHQSRINPWPAFIIATGVIALVSAVALYTFHIISFVKPELATKLHRYVIPTITTLSTSGSFFLFDYIRTGIKGTNPLQLQDKQQREGEVPRSCQSIEEMIDMVRDNTNNTMQALTNACSIHFNLNAQNLGVQTASRFINTFNRIIDNILNDIHQLGQLRATQDLLDITTFSFQDAQMRRKLQQEANDIEQALEKDHQLPHLTDEQRAEKQSRLQALQRRLDHTQFLSQEQRDLRKEKKDLEKALEDDRQNPQLPDAEREAKQARLQVIKESLCIPEDLDLLDKNNPLHQNKKESFEKFINDLANNLEELLKVEVDTPIGKRNLFFILENPILETGAPLVKNKEELARILNELLHTKLFDHEIIKLLKKNIPEIAELEKTTQEFVALFVHYLMDASGMYRSRMVHHIKLAIPKIAEQIKKVRGNNQTELIASINTLFNPNKPRNNAEPSALFLIKNAFESASIETHAIYFTTVVILLLLSAAFAAIPHIKGEMTLLRKRLYVASLISGGLTFTTTMMLLLQHYRWRDIHYTVTPAVAKAPESPRPFPIPGVTELRDEFVLLKDRMIGVLNGLSGSLSPDPESPVLVAEFGVLLAQLHELTRGLDEGHQRIAHNPTLRTFLALDQHMWKQWYIDHAEEMRQKAQRTHEAYIREIMRPFDLQNAAMIAKLAEEKRQAEAAATAAATHCTGNVVQYFVPSRTENMFFLKGLPAAFAVGIQGLKEFLHQEASGGYTYRDLFLGGRGKGAGVGLYLTMNKASIIQNLRDALTKGFTAFRSSVVYQQLAGLPLTQNMLPAMIAAMETMVPSIAKTLLDGDRHKRGRIAQILTDERLDDMIAYLNGLAPEWHQSACQKNYDDTDLEQVDIRLEHIRRKAVSATAAANTAQQQKRENSDLLQQKTNEIHGIRRSLKNIAMILGRENVDNREGLEQRQQALHEELTQKMHEADLLEQEIQLAKQRILLCEQAKKELAESANLREMAIIKREEMRDKQAKAAQLPQHNLTYDEVLRLFDESNKNSPFTLLQEIFSA